MLIELVDSTVFKAFDPGAKVFDFSLDFLPLGFELITLFEAVFDVLDVVGYLFEIRFEGIEFEVEPAGFRVEIDEFTLLVRSEVFDLDFQGFEFCSKLSLTLFEFRDPVFVVLDFRIDFVEAKVGSRSAASGAIPAQSSSPRLPAAHSANRPSSRAAFRR